MDYLHQIREQKPLIHHLTNFVTIADCAQITRSVGALPVMAHAQEEVEEMVQLASALVLNIGTLTPEFVEAQITAAQAANKKGIPVVLDIVGCGATKLRTQAVQDILRRCEVTCIKGNAAEISVLAGANAVVRGVEAESAAENLEELMHQLAAAYQAVIIATGEVDIIVSEKDIRNNKTGHAIMGEVVGTGCMAGSVLGAFLAVAEPKHYLEAAIEAMLFYGKAGEKAGKSAKGALDFKSRFFDAIQND